MMSSATSTERSFRLKAEATETDPGGDGTGQATRPADDAGFRAWHFFVLVSLAAATAAVLLSRRSSPEHLILLSFTIGAAGLAAGALYRMLAPLALRDVSQLSDRPSERARAALEREKALVLRSIKELEFDRAMGKVSPGDFDEMAGRLRARAITLMKQVDAGGSGYRELIERELQLRLKARAAGAPSAAPAPADKMAAVAESPALIPSQSSNPAVAGTARGCVACGTANDGDAAFCKRCGSALAMVAR
jgi:hypothetical protein